MAQTLFSHPFNPALFREIGSHGKEAATALRAVSPDVINLVLQSLAGFIRSEKEALLVANQQDLVTARQNNRGAALIDRLILNEERLKGLAESLQTIIDLPCPVGKLLERRDRPNGLHIKKVTVPIGVLGLIYESRPNVTVDAAALALKSHNAIILRGGSDSFYSSQALHALVQKACKIHGVVPEAVQLIPSPDRVYVDAMLQASDSIDVLIPRGGKSLTDKVMTEATMPVFAHLDGNCHMYIHEDADQAMALQVIENAKFRRTGICGALESLLYHKNLPESFLKTLIDMLLTHDCEIVGDDTIQTFNPAIIPATQEDWSIEYLAKKISIKAVGSVEEAIAHINHYGSHHTDAILTQNDEIAARFKTHVDSAIVMHNTSTQFADGGEFGMGAEIGIATGKLHARGPVGLEQLVTFQYIVEGQGQTRP